MNNSRLHFDKECSLTSVQRRINENFAKRMREVPSRKSFSLSFEQDELTRGTFDMRDVNVARKTIYGYSKIVQIPLSVRHASKSWRITLHIVGDITIALSRQFHHRGDIKSSSFPHF